MRDYSQDLFDALYDAVSKPCLETEIRQFVELLDKKGLMIIDKNVMESIEKTAEHYQKLVNFKFPVISLSILKRYINHANIKDRI